MSTATVTRSVPSTPAPAASGGPVVPYVSAFEQLLLRGRWAALAVVLIWAVCCFWALRSADVATRVIGHDTAPSITAAEGIRSLLADANGELANIMLTSASTSVPFVDAFRSDIAEAEAKLVDAAQNITYGDAEKTPITMIMRGVAEYNELVGEARAVNSAPIALKADDLMRRTILPATEALDQANDDQLTANYANYLRWKFAQTVAVCLLALAALGVLGYLQYQMYLSAKRLLNPGLAAATVIVALFSIYTLSALGAASRDLKTAKSDAFDSIYALTTLQAVANDANATESFWLVAYDDASKRNAYETLFKSLSSEIVGARHQGGARGRSGKAQVPGSARRRTLQHHLRRRASRRRGDAQDLGGLCRHRRSVPRLAERRQACRRNRARHRRQARPIQLGVRSVPEGAAADNQDQPGRF